MTRGASKGISSPIPRGIAEEKGAKLPLSITAFGPARVEVTRSPVPDHARVAWFLGGRPVAFLESSDDLKTWVEVRPVTADGTEDVPLDRPRRFWRLRLQD